MGTHCMENDVIFNEPNVTKNPLLNYLVVKRLFEHFNLEEIKNRRLVCEEWNSVAQEFLRKRSKIIFKNTKDDIPKFLDTFQASHSEYPFTHFEFKQEFFVDEALTFFQKFGRFIKFLKFDHVKMKFQNPDGTILQSQILDSSKWFSQCNNLSELYILSLLGRRQSIPIRYLRSVKKLALYRCDILLEKNIYISPVDIRLCEVYFYVNTKYRLSEFVLNDAFDFQKTDYVYINQLYMSTPSILDVGQGIAKIGSVSLQGVKIINWEKSQWSIESVNPGGLSILDKISIKIKKLIINISTFASSRKETIDFSMLPATLENLHFFMDSTTTFISRNSVYLPNLKQLTIHIRTYEGTLPLFYFRNCPLETVLLRGNVTQEQILDVTMLPQNIRKLDIDGNTIVHRSINVGQKLQVNMLVIHVRLPLLLEACNNILQNIRPSILVLFFVGRECSWDEIVQFVHQNVQLKTIFVNSFLCRLPIDMIRNYSLTYNRPAFSVFEKQACTPITREAFTRAINILNVKNYEIYSSI